MMNENNTNKAPLATPDPREALLNLIGNTLERIHFTPTAEWLDYPQEAMDLLRQIESWTVERHPDGYLILRDPADHIRIGDIA
jgi:hypothetical protein